jgi:hypothetical protein
MKRGFILLLLAFLISLSLVAAVPSLEITEKPINKIIVRELSTPAIYELTIKNNGQGDVFSIDTLLDVLMYPKDEFTLMPDETKTVTVKIFPRASEKSKYYGDWSFEYFVKGDTTGLYDDNIMIKILSLNDIIGIEVPTSINANDKTFIVKVKNNENLSFDIDMKADSTILGYEGNFSLLPLETKEISIDTDSEKLSKEAGTYNLNIMLTVNRQADMKFTRDLILESDTRTTLDISEESTTFIDKATFVKKNTGNTPVTAQISANRTMLQSMITSFNLNPDSVKRDGGMYIYDWSRKLNPGESYTIVMETNYSWPWIVLIVIVAGYLAVRQLTKKPIKIRKKAYRLKTKSGHFAAKIVLILKNTGKEISNAKIIESLPPFTELMQDRFGTIKPAEVRKHSVIWDFARIAAKEEMILSYIVYSKVSVVGNIEVAPAIATYQTGKGIIKESKSNKIIILTEERKPEEPKAEVVK